MGIREGLKQSAINRAKMKKLLGCIPLSVLNLSRGSLSKKMFIYQHERKNRMLISQKNTTASNATKSQQKRIKELTKEFGKIAIAPFPGGHANRHELSIMPAELVDFFVKYYSVPGQVYLDPFMGQGIRMQVAKCRGVHYYGYDLSKEFFSFIQKIKKRIDDNRTKIEIFCGDSRYPDSIPDGIGDFSFTSPPYWDIEYYGDEKEQLGNSSYKEFILSLENVYKAWFPKFKKGAYIVVNINDFRRNKKFYSYHSHTIQALENAGYIIHDMWIINGLVGGLPKAFAVDFNLKKIAPKVHEYCIVARKP